MAAMKNQEVESAKGIPATLPSPSGRSYHGRRDTEAEGMPPSLGSGAPSAPRARVSDVDMHEHREVESLSAWVASRPTRDDGVPPAVLVAAFEGWNDAGEAASDALAHLATELQASRLSEVGTDDYYDYQFTRPRIERAASGARRLVWPSTRVFRASTAAGVDVVLVAGVEPSFKWRSFAGELLTLAEEQNVQAVVALGALLGDLPHSRPLPVSLSSESPWVREATGAKPSSYEGVTGIVGVLAEMADAAGLPTLSAWAQVPHYVSQGPSPKAQLALISLLDSMLGLGLATDEIRDDAAAWERGVNELAERDPEVAAYVEQLEQRQDASEHPEASGDAIALEFERYLKRRDGSAAARASTREEQETPPGEDSEDADGDGPGSGGEDEGDSGEAGPGAVR